MKQTKAKLKVKNNQILGITYAKQHKYQSCKQVAEYVIELKDHHHPTLRRKALKQLVKMCYSNWTNQFYLCNNLNIPFHNGPATLTPIPETFKDKLNQLYALFKYLNKVKQSYICWVIYFDTDLNLLNIKLLTQYELLDLDDIYFSMETVVGVFIGEQYYPKARTMSTKTNIGIYQPNSLSSKTTKQTLFQRKQKVKNKIKSISMKEKKVVKHQFTATIKSHQLSATKESDSKTMKMSTKCLNKTMKMRPNILNQTYKAKY